MLSFGFINFVLLVENWRIVNRSERTKHEKY
jgi:hypothetical protein